MSNKKQFNPEFSLYPTRDGRYNRTSVTPALLEILKNATVGSSLLLMPVSEETKEKIVAGAEARGRTNVVAPSYKVVIMPADDNPNFARSRASDDI